MTLLMNPEAPLSRAQKLASGTGAWVTVGVVLVLASTAVEFFAPPLRQLFAGDVTWRSLVQTVGAQAVLATPNVLLAIALWQLKTVLDEYERANFFTNRASHAVRRAGEWALWAMGYKIVAAGTLYGWIMQTSRGIDINYESFDLGLIAFAGFVMLAGRVLEAATAIKQENDQIV
ncbi:DUF2975 domain-containing protein [Terricaulis sp.]|uniref:DUF2975 domain-containing protein n=1 Tax=Terricaulis sp. TaxID=2768686 RepID=UPI003784E5B9